MGPIDANFTTTPQALKRGSALSSIPSPVSTATIDVASQNDVLTLEKLEYAKQLLLQAPNHDD